MLFMEVEKTRKASVLKHRVDIFKSGDMGSESADNLVAMESKIFDKSDAKDVISAQAEEVSLNKRKVYVQTDVSISLELSRYTLKFPLKFRLLIEISIEISMVH